MEQEYHKTLMLPVICTRGVIYFPGNEMSIEIGRKKSLEALKQANDIYDKYVIIVSQIKPEINSPQVDNLYKVGTLCRIVSSRVNNDRSQRVLFDCIDRVEVLEFTESSGTFFAKAKILQSVFGDKNEEVALVRTLAKTVENLGKTTNELPSNVISQLSKGVSALDLTDMLAHYLPLSLEKKQLLLETLNVNERMVLLYESVEEEKQISEIESAINKKVRDKIDENQK